MKAEKVIDDKVVLLDERLLQRVVWRLPYPTLERPHGLKYQLYCGRAGHCIVCYDNESGKDDHVHYGNTEQPYRFISLDRLIQDFYADVERLSGEIE